MTIALMAIASCKKDELLGPGDNGNNGGQEEVNYPDPVNGATYVLEGTIKTDAFVWKEGASVGLYGAMDGLRIINKECAMEPASVGQAMGKFNTPGLNLLKGKNKFMAYTPYSQDLSYANGTIYGLSIGDEQVQSAPNAATDCFSVATFDGIPGVDETFKFELAPVTALAQVKLASSSLGDLAPKTVTIWDDSGNPMAGGFNIEVSSMTVTLLETGKKSKVAVSATTPSKFSETASQNFYIQILPGDYSSKELWIAIDLEDAEGKITTIPVKKSGLVFTAGETTLIDLGDLSYASNDAAWYAAGETRLLTGNQVAYGEANTYLIQCKDGNTYTGATYQENSEIPDEVVIDYRARGNFSNAVAPEGVTFEWAQISSGVYTPRVADYEASGVVIKDKFTITHDAANYTVKVKNTGAYAGAPILLMKKGNDILWAWSFWNIAADGTKLTPVTVGNYQFAPMDIGQPTTNAEKWIANSTKAGNPDVMFRLHHYYQFGRPIPIFWTTTWSLDGAPFEATSQAQYATGIGNVPAIPSQMTLTESLANPVGFIVKTEINTVDARWCSDEIKDIWGTNDNTKEGVKSIYDPCPKGWRLPSWKALNTVASQTPTWNVATNGDCHLVVGGLKLVLAGRLQAKRSSASSYGAPTNYGMGNNGKIANCKHLALWANVAGSTQGQSLYVEYNTNDVAKSSFRMGTFDYSQANPVRCIVDTDNR